MFMFTIVVVPGDHQVGQCLTLKSACKHVWLFVNMSDCCYVPMWGHTQDLGDTGLKFTNKSGLEIWTGESPVQVVMKMACDLPNAEWQAAQGETL